MSLLLFSEPSSPQFSIPKFSNLQPQTSRLPSLSLIYKSHDFYSASLSVPLQFPLALDFDYFAQILGNIAILAKVDSLQRLGAEIELGMTDFSLHQGDIEELSNIKKFHSIMRTKDYFIRIESQKQNF